MIINVKLDKMVVPTIEFFEGQKNFVEESNINKEDKEKLFSLYDECIRIMNQKIYDQGKLQEVCDEISIILKKVQGKRKVDDTLLWIFLFLIFVIVIFLFPY